MLRHWVGPWVLLSGWLYRELWVDWWDTRSVVQLEATYSLERSLHYSPMYPQ